jgi:hypothetical protein
MKFILREGTKFSPLRPSDLASFVGANNDNSAYVLKDYGLKAVLNARALCALDIG